MSEDVKKTPKSSNTERNKKARAARVAKAIKRGRKAGRTVDPAECHPPSNWDIQRPIAKRMSSYRKAIAAFTTRPACGLKGRTLPDCPALGSAREELRENIRELKAEAKAEAKPEAKAEAKGSPKTKAKAKAKAE